MDLYIQTYKKVLLLSKLCYETIRGYSNSIDEDYLEDWYNSSEDVRKFMVEEVLYSLSNEDVDVETLHKRWYNFMINQGWEYGESVDLENKKHPNLVEYNNLNREQKSKYYIFRTLCNFHKE